MNVIMVIAISIEFWVVTLIRKNNQSHFMITRLNKKNQEKWWPQLFINTVIGGKNRYNLVNFIAAPIVLNKYELSDFYTEWVPFHYYPKCFLCIWWRFDNFHSHFFGFSFKKKKDQSIFYFKQIKRHFLYL